MTQNVTKQDLEPPRGSMVPFWVVIAVAGLCLVAYLIVAASRFGAMTAGFGESGKSSGNGLIAQDRRRDVPGFSFKDLSGGPTLSREDLEGKVVVLHYWASFCQPCVHEFPSYARYASERMAHMGGDVVAVSVSLDRSDALASSFVERIDVPVKIYRESGKGLAEKLGIRMIPTTVLIDREGRIAFRAAGAQRWDGDGIPSMVDVLTYE